MRSHYFCCHHYPCCEAMREMSKDISSPILYNPEKQVYYLAGDIINHCPSCGAKNNFDKVVVEEPKSKDFCCSAIEEQIINPPSFSRFQIFYQPIFRRFFIAANGMFWEENTLNYPEWDFCHCPYCGIKLSVNLFDKWLELVTTKFCTQRIVPFERMLPFVPEEFRTELWWKKCGF